MKPLEEVHGSVDTGSSTSWWKRFVLFIGPAFMVCVGYMDPGNWATDIAGGSAYGYQLLWVLLLSNGMALLLQSLAARLGIVRGLDLAQASREYFPKTINYTLWLLAEVAIAACDLAEVLGMAIGLQLLFGMPLIWGVGLAVFDTFLILFLQKKGIRYLEVFIFSLVALIGVSFFVQLLFANPDWGQVATGFVPSKFSPGALFIAIGIIGATVMPHNLYLHSSLVQTRRNGTDENSIRQSIRFNFFDSAIALNLAFFVNISILIVSAAVFYKNGLHDISSIEDAHRLLAPLVGQHLAPILFAIALIAAGQSSTITGTLAGQIVMEGYLHLRIAPWIRRLITRSIAVVPALFIIYFMGEKKADEMLIFSQVILSLQLGFAVIPLIHFVSDKLKMKTFVIPLWQKIASWLVALTIVSLNLKLVFDTLLDSNGIPTWLLYGVLLPIVIAGIFLLIVITFFPFFKQKTSADMQLPHGKAAAIPPILPQQYKSIAICVDFSDSDIKAITTAGGLITKETPIYLIHIVESALARATGKETRDYETLADWENLQQYVADLQKQGYNAQAKIGFGDARKAIPKIINEEITVDLLVIGSHGHNTLKDIVYGETISAVRHSVHCHVLIV